MLSHHKSGETCSTMTINKQFLACHWWKKTFSRCGIPPSPSDHCCLSDTTTPWSLSKWIHWLTSGQSTFHTSRADNTLALSMGNGLYQKQSSLTQWNTELCDPLNTLIWHTVLHLITAFFSFLVYYNADCALLTDSWSVEVLQGNTVYDCSSK